jgi:hypothetical protein
MSDVTRTYRVKVEGELLLTVLEDATEPVPVPAPVPDPPPIRLRLRHPPPPVPPPPPPPEPAPGDDEGTGPGVWATVTPMHTNAPWFDMANSYSATEIRVGWCHELANHHPARTVVERSPDGVNGWQEVARVAPADSIAPINNYTISTVWRDERVEPGSRMSLSRVGRGDLRPAGCEALRRDDGHHAGRRALDARRAHGRGLRRIDGQARLARGPRRPVLRGAAAGCGIECVDLDLSGAGHEGRGFGTLRRARPMSTNAIGRRWRQVAVVPAITAKTHPRDRRPAHLEAGGLHLSGQLRAPLLRPARLARARRYPPFDRRDRDQVRAG